ncbi:MAG TPA: TonB-dependent receptor [Terriglobales bacterium]|nr:TonB-dependent receptor [Terriglobales bacterium]
MFARSCLLLLAALTPAFTQNMIAVHGRVLNALGRPLAAATVTATASGGEVLATTQTDADGEYELRAPAAAVLLTARHAGLAAASEPLRAAPAPLVLGLAPVETSINVTATGLSLPAAQVGNSVTTISSDQITRGHPLQAATVLRQQPGLGVVQSGQTGGVVSVFLRGAPANFTKVLLDGVPIQRLDLGGYDFANLAPVGLEEMQVLRGPDSVIYGSDAAAGVIAVRTRRGSDVAVPEFDSTTVAGAYATLQQSDQLLGAVGGFDYALRYGYLGSHNQVPGSKFRNNSYGANLGWRLPTGFGAAPAELRLTVQRNYADTGQPNALLFYGLSEGAFKHQAETYGGLSYSQQITPQWRQQVRYSEARANLFSAIPAPAGVPDGLGDYLGLPVTITGANGYSVQGQAILSFGGAFPQLSPSDTRRRDLAVESTLQLAPGWSLVEGYRYFDERGVSSNLALRRHNHGAYVVLNGGLYNRLFLNGGVSLDHNTPFGTTANPQASLAWYPRLGGGAWGATRLRASGGTGLKDPELEVEQFSLYQELLTDPSGPGLIAQFHLRPLQPERSRNFDAGVDQFFAAGRGRLSATWFEQRYYDLIEDIPASAFPALGIPAAVAQVALYGGEYNSLDQSARGLELSTTFQPDAHWQLRGDYTATAACVLRSYSFDAQAPAINPNFPGIPIGAFAPLAGARPFRVAPQTGSLEVVLTQGRFSGDATAYFAARRDDSTFLTDSGFGNTLLLPNHNLDAAYGILDLAGSWRLSPRWQLLAAVDNALNHSYQEVIGYPGPKITARVGIKMTWRARPE